MASGPRGDAGEHPGAWPGNGPAFMIEKKDDDGSFLLQSAASARAMPETA